MNSRLLISKSRRGLSRVELCVVLVLISILFAIGTRSLLYAREASRKTTCRARIAALVRGMEQYHQIFERLPAAAHWDATILQTPELHRSQHWEKFVCSNWTIELLPFLNLADVYETFQSDELICSPTNRHVREQLLPGLVCDSDTFATVSNHYARRRKNVDILFARGNFAINGGTHCYRHDPGNTSTPNGDHAHLLNSEPGEFEFWGNGIAGINKSFRFDDFENPRSSLVAVNEIRSGIDSADLRGTWALGHIAASITWGHGVNGDAYCPNNTWARSDDIEGGGYLNEKYGPEPLIELGMPCVSYVDVNQNATSRSQHKGGANAGFLDGSVRFISDSIDPSLWHVLHSRETPANALADVDYSWSGAKTDAERRRRQSSIKEPFTNSLGMDFVFVPPGNFLMGVPDEGVSSDLPPETPPHEVQLSDGFHLATTEVTIASFNAVMRADESVADPTLPITDVTWEEAAEFCHRLSELPAEKIQRWTYRLPTEAEWEYACRETGSEAFKPRRARKTAQQTGEVAGLGVNTPLTSVASFPPNSLGLYDMRGNAWEWCADWFDRDYYLRSPRSNPKGPAHGYAKVIRGSDWIYAGEGCFINYPILPPWKKSPLIGFRIVAEMTPNK